MKAGHCRVSLLLLLLVLFPQAVFPNALRDHLSPYLAMHGQDPVAWQDWNKDAVDTARRENKLLFVSIGYFACHWCHVMQRESYANPDIAAVLNRHFVPVKVDRELHPALDARLLEFTERTHVRDYLLRHDPPAVLVTDGDPLVNVAAWAVAVWGALLGSLGLLVRKAWAVWVFGASLLGLAASTVYNFVLSNGAEVMGDSAVMFTAVIWVIGLFLFFYAKAMARRGGLR